MDPKKKSLAATERDEQARNEFKTHQAKLEADKVVVLNECGTNTSLTPTHAWSPKGQRANATAPRNRGKNITLIAALTTKDALAAQTSMVIEGPLTGQFLRHTLRRCFALTSKVDKQ